MKNTTRQKMRNCPSKNTRWAYMMQAIEPTSVAINKAFPDYHPQWVCKSQMMTIAPANFMFLRLIMGMTVEQCAAYLRVSYRTITRWESGHVPIPFAVFELLRVVYESAQFKLSHAAWDGWFIGKNGELVSPYEGNTAYTPTDLKLLSQTHAEKKRLSGEVDRLQSELDAAIAENIKLRQMFLSQGVVDELYAMHDRLSSLVTQIATAHVVEIESQISKPVLEKVA